MIILPLHGYNVRDRGKGSVDTFSTALKACGHDYMASYADYGWVGLLGTRFGGIGRIGQQLAHRINRDFPSDAKIVLLCHSNGLAVAHETIKHTSRVYQIISFNGALDQDASFSHTVKHIDNFYAPADTVLKWGAWLRPGHIWGRAGQAGLTQEDDRIHNYEMQDVRGHSSVFQVKALRDKYAQKVCDLLT